MITNSANSDGLGWGFKSIGRGLKKAGGLAVKGVTAPTKLAYKSTKWVTQKTVIAPTKFIAKQSWNLTKGLTNLMLRPVRAKMNTLKGRRARLLSWQNRKSLVPNAAESAQARKDVKAMLSSKGPHGKALALLAGPEMDGTNFGDFGAAPVAAAAIGILLTAAAQIISSAAKSKFAPATVAAVQTAATVTAAATAPEEAPAEPVTQEEVAAEPAVQEEEAATEAATEALEGALADAGMLQGVTDALPAAAAPASMDEKTARKIASAAQRMVCAMSAPAIAAIGGLDAVNAAGSFCRALNAGDEATARATLPTVVQIASRQANVMAARTLSMGVPASGGLPNDGFGAAKKGRKCGIWDVVNVKDDSGFPSSIFCNNSEAAVATRADFGVKRPRDMDRMAKPNLDGDEIGMLATFAGADLEGLSYGLSGVSSDDLAASASAATGSWMVLVPAGLAVLVGFWAARR